MKYITLCIVLIFSLISHADDCYRVSKHTKVKNIETKKVSKIFKGEYLIDVEAKGKKLYSFNLGESRFLIYKSKVSKQAESCSEVIGQCISPKKNTRLRDSVLKNHKKVLVKKGEPLNIVNFFERNERAYYRLTNSEGQFLWISSRQKSRLFKANCSSAADDSELAVSESTSEVDALEDYMSTPDDVSSATVDSDPEVEKPIKMTSNFYFNLGYGLGLSSEFLEGFIDKIADVNGVKADPNPIITGVKDGNAPMVEVHYRKNIFNEKIFWDASIGYRYESYIIEGKKNPSTTATIVRLKDLEGTELDVNLSLLQFGGAGFYAFDIFKSMQLLAGLNIYLNYYLNEKIEFIRKEGADKLSEVPTTLNLSAIGVGLAPELQLVTAFGLSAHLKYNYIFDYGGFPSLGIGYHF